MFLEIIRVKKNKKLYLDLLLLADEQENMIDKYLEEGEMFVLNDNGIKAECVVLKISAEDYELKNIAVDPAFHRQGYGKKLMDFVCDYYKDKNIYVGTGDSKITIPFYEKCGFTKSHIIKNFFVDNYDHPIFEDDTQMIDMIYLKKSSNACNRIDE